MNAAAGMAFAIALGFAIGNWTAVARSSRALEYVCKPATLVALIAAAGLLDPVADAHTRRAWFVAALIFSLAGDILLMLPRDLFVPGLAAFLVGHVCYLVGFWTRGPSAILLVVEALVVLVFVVPLARVILGAIARGDEPPELRFAVTGYIAVISAMLATALATRNVVAGEGAVLFVVSDTMIAWNRFVRRYSWMPVAIMVTYHLGQAGLVASLLRAGEARRRGRRPQTLPMALLVSACRGTGASATEPRRAASVRATIMFAGDSNVAYSISALATALTDRDEAYQLVDIARAGTGIRTPACSQSVAGCPAGGYWAVRLPEARAEPDRARLGIHRSGPGASAYANLVARALDRHFPV